MSFYFGAEFDICRNCNTSTIIQNINEMGICDICASQGIKIPESMKNVQISTKNNIRKGDLINFLYANNILKHEHGLNVIKKEKEFESDCDKCGYSKSECKCTHNLWVGALNTLPVE